MGEIIPFSVWIILFPVLKINFQPLGSNKKHLKKRSFFIRGLDVREMISFPVWMIPFPVLKIDFDPLGSNVKHFVKGVF